MQPSDRMLRGLTPGRAAPALGLTLREAWDRALAGLVPECDAAKAAGFAGNAYRQLLTLATSLGIPRIEARPGVYAYRKDDLPRLRAARAPT